MNNGATHPQGEAFRPQSTASKPSFVTNVTLHWYTAGIQFPAAEAPQSRSSRPRAFFLKSILRSLSTRSYSTTPRPLAGSCITGVGFCI